MISSKHGKNILHQYYEYYTIVIFLIFLFFLILAYSSLSDNFVGEETQLAKGTEGAGLIAGAWGGRGGLMFRRERRVDRRETNNNSINLLVQFADHGLIK